MHYAWRLLSIIVLESLKNSKSASESCATDWLFGGGTAPRLGLAGANENELKLTEKEILALRAKARNTVISNKQSKQRRACFNRPLLCWLLQFYRELTEAWWKYPLSTISF